LLAGQSGLPGASSAMACDISLPDDNGARAHCNGAASLCHPSLAATRNNTIIHGHSITWPDQAGMARSGT